MMNHIKLFSFKNRCETGSRHVKTTAVKGFRSLFSSSSALFGQFLDVSSRLRAHGSLCSDETCPDAPAASAKACEVAKRGDSSRNRPETQRFRMFSPLKPWRSPPFRASFTSFYYSFTMF